MEAANRARDLPEGVDLEKLRRDLTERVHQFVYEGERWTFSYRPVTWEQHWNAIEGAWEPDEDGPKFNAPLYYRTLLLMSVTKIPGGGPLTEELLREWDTAVIAKLSTIIPSPVLDLAAEEVKKGRAGVKRTGTPVPKTGGV